MADVTTAILADIHGNSWALDAVLADLDRRGITAIFDLGDSLYGPLDPAGTAERLIARDIPSIRGNCDRLLIDPSDASAATVAYTLAQLAPQSRYLAWLAVQPLTRSLDEGSVLLCHGTPNSDETYLLELPTAEGGALLPDEEIARRAGDVSAKVICCAHSHVPRLVALRDGRLIVNPGSVGMPAYTEDTPVPHVMQAGSPHARYAILTRDGMEGGWSVEQVALPYDWDAAAACARRNGRDDWAEGIATGRANLALS